MVNLKVIGLDIEVPAWVILLPSSAILLYMYGCRNHDYYKKQGILGPKPLPFIGNLLDFANFDSVGNCDIELRRKYGDVVACYMGMRPNLIVYDQELLSEVLVKQFSNFQNRMLFTNGDKIVDSFPTQMEDDQWKHARTTMSPTFTTGKLRQMADEINRCAKQLREKLTGSGEAFEMRELAANFSMDVILSTAFGLRSDSQNSEDNPFATNGRKFADINIGSSLFVISLIYPTIGRFFYKLGFHFLDKKSTQFFVNVIRETMANRTADTGRADFVGLMCKARDGYSNYSKEDEHEVEKLTTSGNRIGLTETEILGNALFFFFAGYDTTSMGVTMLLYNLARNQDCQDKVHEEIDDIIGEQDDVTYDDVMKMPYLDQCMQESLRLYPGLPRIDRVACADVDLNGIKVPKGSAITIPVYALHMDPNVWEDPERFDPERFSPEGRAQRNPIMWQPFGYGPRGCIGQRLARYELKLAIVQTLRNHRIVTCSKTEENITWKKGMWLKPEKGIWLAVEKRK